MSSFGWRHSLFAPAVAVVVSALLMLAGAVGALLRAVGATTAPTAAELVVTLIIAVFLTTVLRIVRAVPEIQRENAAIRRARANIQAAGTNSDTLVGRRLALFKEAAEAGTDPEAVLSARSALDEGEMANKHHLDHALIWALPVFGFIGTALTMAAMVTSFADGLDGDGSPARLMTALKAQVLPELASAFGVTLIALFLSVLAFGLMAFVERGERMAVGEADEVFLTYVARLPAKQAGPAMHGLVQELALTRGRTEELTKGLDALRTAVEQLSAIEGRPHRYTLVREP
ncbi:hypothetical protein [Nonomuraea sediminis]|uniref:hypothetical protein n=1 Tax=Nonomuraea sediminis TaxID=2835864 RepID=UPI001BDD82E4|nr:hypothetical protein [Nonomuraea sediminis]